MVLDASRSSKVVGLGDAPAKPLGVEGYFSIIILLKQDKE